MSPRKQVSKSKSTLPDGYLEILGSDSLIDKSPKATVEETDDINQLISDKQKTLARAMKAATEGDAEEASYLFRLHSKMVIPQATETNRPANPLPKASTTLDTIATKIDLTRKDEATDDETPFMENGITFMPGERFIT